MFRRKATIHGDSPAAPHFKSVDLPSFRGRGYESDSMTKATSPLRRPHAEVKQTSVMTPVRRAARTSEAFIPPEEPLSPPRSYSGRGGMAINTRTRTGSISSVSSQSASTSWGESSATRVDAPWTSSQSSSSSRRGSFASDSKAYMSDDPYSSRIGWDGKRTRKASFLATPKSSTKTGGGSSRNKLKDVNVSVVPMKQDPPTAVHWQLIPYSLRQGLRHPPLHFDLASDIDDNKDNICFTNSYPRRPLTSKELGKTACDVEQMVIRCESLPKWARWLVVVNCSKDNIIRCDDVFKEIHKTFHQRMTPGELACIPAKDAEACEIAFAKRCVRNAGLTAWNKKQGMRRVDFLQDKTIFNGLTFDKDDSIWVLHLTASRWS